MLFKVCKIKTRKGYASCVDFYEHPMGWVSETLIAASEAEAGFLAETKVCG